jgi:hypothetical protein
MNAEGIYTLCSPKHPLVKADPQRGKGEGVVILMDLRVEGYRPR